MFIKIRLHYKEVADAITMLRDHMDANIPTGSDIEGNILYKSVSANLSGGVFEKDYGLVYENNHLNVQLTHIQDYNNVLGMSDNSLKVSGSWWF